MPEDFEARGIVGYGWLSLPMQMAVVFFLYRLIAWVIPYVPPLKQE
ncbi:MAG TPA: hypothetical protein VFI38_06940 [Candidatus Acidoferrum sp.]|nr:hypothetical protein [Candidatus Acidoferrum sp.]